LKMEGLAPGGKLGAGGTGGGRNTGEKVGPDEGQVGHEKVVRHRCFGWFRGVRR